MAERQDLVPFTTIESPLFSPEHKVALVKQTTLYLQSKRILINKASFDAGAEVVVDALKRGLAISGVDISKSGRNITKYIKEGITQRDEIRTGNWEIFRKNSNRGDLPNAGEYAISTLLVDAAYEESRQFYLKGDISVSEKLYETYKTRQRNLSEIADKVIGYLPEVLIENAKEQLKTDDEKSRLLKNTLVSAVFSKKINPIISINDLWNHFQNYQKTPDDYFKEQNVEDFANKLGLDSKQREFMADLFKQTKANFESKKSETFTNEDKDKLYSRFSKDLLLLHPALEEVQIVLDYDKRDGFTQSVWDDGVCHEIKGFKVPSRAILGAAQRQAEAAGAAGRINRISEALRSWSYFDFEKTNHPKKIRELQIQIDKENNEIKSLRAEWEEKGKPRKNIVNILDKKRLESGHASFVYKGVRRQVRLSREKLAEAKKLLEMAEASGSGRFRLPKGYYAVRLSNRIQACTAARTLSYSNVDKEGRLLENRLSRLGMSFVREEVTQILPKIYDKEAFLKYAKEFENIYQQVVNSTTKHIFKKTVENGADFKLYLLENIDKLRYKSFRLHYGFSKMKNWDVNSLAALARMDLSNKKVLNISSKVILNLVGEQIRKLERQYAVFDRAEAGLAEAKKKKELLAKDKFSPDEDAYRSLNWGRNYFLECQISELGENMTEQFGLEEREFINLAPGSFSRFLPQTVDKEGYRSAIENSFPVLEKEIDDKKYWVDFEMKRNPEGYEDDGVYLMRVANLHRADDNLVQANLFLELSDSKYFNFELASGMKTKRYIELISRKILLMKRLGQLGERRKDYVKLASEVDKLKLELKLFKEMRKKAEMEEKLNELKTVDPAMKHIGRMRELGLAVQV